MFLYGRKIAQVVNSYVTLEGDDRSSLSLKTYDEAVAVAEELNSYPENKDKNFLSVDRGEWVRPQFDVVEGPVVGAEVSRGFNGDYYPAGKIVKVWGSESRFVLTDTGVKFNRRRKTSSWVESGGGFSMVPGVRDERNPSF